MRDVIGRAPSSVGRVNDMAAAAPVARDSQRCGRKPNPPGELSLIQDSLPSPALAVGRVWSPGQCHIGGAEAHALVPFTARASLPART